MEAYQSPPRGIPPVKVTFMGAGAASYNKRKYFVGLPAGTQLTPEIREHMVWHERVGPAPFGGGVSGFVERLGDVDVYEVYVYTD